MLFSICCVKLLQGFVVATVRFKISLTSFTFILVHFFFSEKVAINYARDFYFIIDKNRQSITKASPRLSQGGSG